MMPDAAHDLPRPFVADWLMAPIRRHRAIYIRVIVAAIAVNLLSLVTSMFSMTVYDRVVPNNAMASLVALSIGVAMLLVFDFALKLLRARFVDIAGMRIDDEVGAKVFARLLDLRADAAGHAPGRLNGIVKELESLREFFASATLVAVVDVPFVLVAVMVMWLIGGAIVLVPVVTMALVIAVAAATQPLMRRLAAATFHGGLSKNSILIEAVGGLETIQASRAGGFLTDRWTKACHEHGASSFSQRFIAAIANNAAMSAQTLSYVGVVIVGAAMVGSHAMSTGAIVACSILSGRALAPLGQITQLLTRLHATRTAYRQIDRLMPAGEAEVTVPRFTPTRVAGRLELREVAYRYPGRDVAAVEGITLAIEAGQRVALVGTIGSGKTTVARLLAGLVAPSHGQVLLDGLDLRSYDTAQLRAATGVVLQDSILFSGSVGDNIALGRDGIDAEEVLRVAQLSGTHQFMEGIADGYSLLLADRGAGLSGGQKQSIAIARALAGRPPVLVLDEPSSAMDPASEHALLQRLLGELAGRTVIVVTHRPQLLEFVDRVIRIEGGHVVSDTPRDAFLDTHPVTPRHFAPQNLGKVA